MAKLSVEGLIAIHRIIQEKYPLKLEGIQYPNKLKDMVDRPNMIVYGHEPYNTIFKKAACLMEGIIRGHAFFDGNKRTGLMATFAYLQNHDYYLALPIDVVKFTVRIATDKSRDEESIDKLIVEIAEWLEKHSARTYFGFAGKLFKHTTLPTFGVLFLTIFGFKKIAEQKIDDWYQLKFHGDYVDESAKETTSLIRNSIKDSIKAIFNKPKLKYVKQ